MSRVPGMQNELAFTVVYLTHGLIITIRLELFVHPDEHC